VSNRSVIIFIYFCTNNLNIFYVHGYFLSHLQIGHLLLGENNLIWVYMHFSHVPIIISFKLKFNFKKVDSIVACISIL